jgi:hypothetical protein
LKKAWASRRRISPASRPIESSDRQVPIAGPVYVELIREQLHDEDERKDSCEKRGVIVITTSASLASLLYGLTSVISSTPHTGIADWARYFLYGALFFFGAAALAAILTNLPLRYRGIKTDRLLQLVQREEWEKPAPPAERGAAKAQLAMLKARTTRGGACADAAAAVAATGALSRRTAQGEQDADDSLRRGPLLAADRVGG